VTEEQVLAFVVAWQHRLGLDLWRITVVFESIEPSTITMQVHKCRDYERATIKVQPWVLTNSPPPEWLVGIGCITDLDIEEAVVHELLHCCLDKLWNWPSLLGPETHVDALGTAVRAFDHDEESVVDKLAVALVRAWPFRGLTDDDRLQTPREDAARRKALGGDPYPHIV
jgi:hypothetical protein